MITTNKEEVISILELREIIRSEKKIYFNNEASLLPYSLAIFQKFQDFCRKPFFQKYKSIRGFWFYFNSFSGKKLFSIVTVTVHCYLKKYRIVSQRSSID